MKLYRDVCTYDTVDSNVDIRRYFRNVSRRVICGILMNIILQIYYQLRLRLKSFAKKKFRLILVAVSVILG